jgi:anti-sigma factor RsiW
MNCQTARESFAALLNSRTDLASQPEARAHLANCPECQREYATLRDTLDQLDTLPSVQPSPRLRREFQAMLAAEKRGLPHTPSRRPPRLARVAWLRWIVAPALACALVVAGFFAGSRHSSSSATAQLELQRRIDELQRKVDTVGQLVFSPLLQQNPVNERLRGVLASAQTAQPSNKDLDDLIGAVAFDPSANVRLRALEALYPFADRELVRAGVLGALGREQHPLVQLVMIDFVAAAHDREAVPCLERLAQSESADRSVREAARLALAQL